MKEPLTEELLQELLASPDPLRFADKHRIGKRNLPEYLQQLLDEKGLVRSAVVREAGINETFGYQIFMGQRNASRDKILQLAFAMGLTLTESNRLLQAAGVNELYCKNRRDAIIIFCLDKGYSLQKTDEELYRFGEETIC
ncbi:helix-turn-helix domain-containing protein [Raoultibacter phocaeensis]|uniref:helix-turn-helix domain-containing protein n=1 Tax=Raoultibacter phocaeensis TaxID=2479841 RepID=UPI001119BB0D|nr:helix-turn-helix transcriptional regulator [Raoultibacter phocaeensis]